VAENYPEKLTALNMNNNNTRRMTRDMRGKVGDFAKWTLGANTEAMREGDTKVEEQIWRD